MCCAASVPFPARTPGRDSLKIHRLNAVVPTTNQYIHMAAAPASRRWVLRCQMRHEGTRVHVDMRTRARTAGER